MLTNVCEIDEDGNRSWHNSKGNLHRLDGPAIELINGTKIWCKNNKTHRLDGPAMECNNGDNAWYLNGEKHRLNGPALFVLSDSIKKYWIEGKKYTEEKFNKKRRLKDD